MDGGKHGPLISALLNACQRDHKMDLGATEEGGPTGSWNRAFSFLMERFSTAGVEPENHTPQGVRDLLVAQGFRERA